MRSDATEEQAERISDRIRFLGLEPRRVPGRMYIAIAAVGDSRALDPRQMSAMEGVKEVVRISEPYKLASRSLHPADTIVKVRNVEIGGPATVIMAGPCSIESRQQMKSCAQAVVSAGATVIRGGAYKPRTSPYTFQGLGEEGLRLIREVADEVGGHPVISELMDARHLDGFIGNVDILQIGARNMQNFTLLKEVGRCELPVLLKRGMSSTIEEWLLAAEHIMSEGNRNVILCERGIRTFETATRNTLDLAAIPVVKSKTHLPIIIDPSHALGRRDCIISMSRAAIAAGADGLLIEVHDNPDNALCDGAQALLPEMFQRLVEECDAIAHVLGRSVAGFGSLAH